MPISGFLFKQSAFYSRTEKETNGLKMKASTVCVRLISNLKTAVCCDSLVIMRKKSLVVLKAIVL